MRTFGTLLFGATLLLTACGGSGSYREYQSRDEPRAMTVGAATLTVEVAWTRAAREQGLMYRESMPEDRGMLFIYPEPEILGFWMKNTLIPLSIAFVDADGMIVNIEKMEPHRERPRAVSLKPVRFALEVNQNWFENHGIGAGDRIELPAWALEILAEPA